MANAKHTTRYVVRCLDCLMFGTPKPPSTQCGNCNSKNTEKWMAPEAFVEVEEVLKASLTELTATYGNLPQIDSQELVDKIRALLAKLQEKVKP